MNELLQADKELFLRINRDWQNPFFDFLFPFLRQPYFWVPVYTFLIVFALMNIKRRAWVWILFFVAAAGLSDFISAGLLKPTFARIRPCNEPSLIGEVRLLVKYCGGNGSFPSTHSSTHFAVAAFLYSTLYQFFQKWGLLFFVWAISVCIAQIYVGVHYPFDILGGALLGSLIGITTAVFYRHYFKSDLYP